MTPRQGLVPVQKLVSRGGRTFTTTVWVKPGDKPKVQTTAQVKIPEWNFKDVAAFETEVARINKIKDPSEKKVIKEHLLADLKKNGITFKEDTGSKADAVNWMRALMATKKHLKAGNSLDMTQNNQNNSNQTQQPSQPAQQPQAQPAQSGTGKVVLGTGQNMSKDDAKKAVADLRGQLGTQGVMDLAEKNGIHWAKNANNIANSYMQCAMKLSKHLQNGGTLTDDGKAAAKTDDKKNVPPVVAPTADKKDDKKPDEPKLDPKSIEHDWYNAPKKFKMVGMITGILPTDEKTHDYLTGLIKSGKFDLADGAATDIHDDYRSVASKVGSAIAGNGDATSLKNARPEQGKSIFTGSPYEKTFKKYESDYAEVKKKYGETLVNNDVATLKHEVDAVEYIGKLCGKDDLSSITQEEALEKLMKKFKTATKTEAAASKLWDDLGLSESLGMSIYSNDQTKMKKVFSVINGGDGYWNSLLGDVVDVNRAAGRTKGQLLDSVAAGTISKQEALKTVVEGLEKYQKGTSFKGKSITQPFASKSTFGVKGTNLLGVMVSSGQTSVKEFKSLAKNAAKDQAKLYTDSAYFIRMNIALKNEVDNLSFNYNRKDINVWQPIDKDLYDSATDKSQAIERHLWLLGKPVTERKKWLKDRKDAKKKHGDTNYLQAFQSNTDAETLDFPDHKDIRDKVKASLESVEGTERTKVEQKIEATHDMNEHRSFKTKVHGVYRIKNLPYEDEFQKIDKDRNNTDFYYHGTGYSASQKIIGESGQFVVTKTNVKAGRMLGDGVYLANNSSKSMQYASNDFSRSTGARGVLYVCKASLGKVVESKTAGSSHNGPLLNRKDVDTVFMDRPYVRNPEWAVKEEKAVIPRLWIDVERVQR
ncbi:hypothetical protein M3_0224 [Lysinibacillus phage vB_LfM_LysYB1]|nr:hypothetical protein M3_0224 [Lysinibacillus phage vB_LfM_LysYB1]WAB25264.1 hypothetical protein M5_0086 [Lysinibacillus phage vB_LfM_LysYB2]